MTYEATHLRENLYAVRPRGALGTCGWMDGSPWQVQYIHARCEEDAVRKAHPRASSAKNHNRRPLTWADMVE